MKLNPVQVNNQITTAKRSAVVDRILVWFSRLVRHMKKAEIENTPIKV